MDLTSKKLYTPAAVKSLLDNADKLDQAHIFSDGVDKPQEFQVVTFTLTANTALARNAAQVVNFPFKSLWVMSVTHPALKIRLTPTTNEEIQKEAELRADSVINFGDSPVSKAYVWWDAQNPGPSVLQVKVLFSRNADIKSGTISSIRGGVKTDMYSFAIQQHATLTAGVQGLLSDPAALTQVAGFTTNSTDRQCLIYNDGNAILYVGPSSSVDDGTASAGAYKGYPVNPGDSFKWNNKANLYGFFPTGTTQTGVTAIIEYDL